MTTKELNLCSVQITHLYANELLSSEAAQIIPKDYISWVRDCCQSGSESTLPNLHSPHPNKSHSPPTMSFATTSTALSTATNGPPSTPGAEQKEASYKVAIAILATILGLVLVLAIWRCIQRRSKENRVDLEQGIEINSQANRRCAPAGRESQGGIKVAKL